VDIIHVAPPDPDFVGYMKSGDPAEKTQDNLIRDSQAKALRDEHQQTQDLAAALRVERGSRRTGFDRSGTNPDYHYRRDP
jgi:hypothetical protein